MPDNKLWNIALADLARSHGRTITFAYAKGPGQTNIETRQVRPTAIDENAIIGLDPDRDNDYRAFRLDRIKGEATV